MEVYEPSDDSFFFAGFLKNYLKKNKPSTFIDMGCVSGILAKTLVKSFPKENILCADINPSAVSATRLLGFKTIKSNLFSKIPKEQKFDLITFNAPYLPEEEKEPESSKLITTGGKEGDEISLKFIEQAKKHLTDNGKILLLISSLTPLEKINKFHPKILAKKSLFFEKLLILEFRK
ncbi:MAG: HemK2/MTQ2 family protein methyltransferase [archaeon]